MNQRQQILARMEEVMGPLPPAERRPRVQWAVIETKQQDGIEWKRIDFAVECDTDGQVTDWCPAWLLTPQSPAARRRPAVLCLHQTVNIGKGEPVGLGGSANLHYACELAQRGFVVLAPDYPRFGDYKIDVYAMGYVSASMKGVWNHSIAVDLLASLPTVDASCIGCVGHSLGGHNALFLAAFDPRIKAAVSSCGFTLFEWNDDEGRGSVGDLTDWSHAGYMPRIKSVYGCRADQMPFDFDDVLQAIAPRALFVNAPEKDFFQVAGVRQCIERVRGSFADADLRWAHPEGGHDFPPAVREEAYRFLERALVS